LQELSLTGLDARALDALAAAPQLAALTSLSLTACGAHAGTVSAAHRRRLAAAAAAAAGGGDSDDERDGSDSDSDSDGDAGGGSEDGSDDAASGGGDEEDADDELWHIASAPWYEQLRALSLEACGLRDLGPLPGGLEALSLARNRLCDAAAVLLAAAPLPRLRRLDLSGNADLGSRGAAALARAPWLRGGFLGGGCGSGCGSGGGAAAAAPLAPAGLWSLNLGGCRVGDEGAAALAAAPGLRGALRALALPSSIITDTAVAALAAAGPENLVELDLTGAPPGAPAPPRNPRLGRGRAAWRKLAAAPLWGLRRLDLRGAGLSPAAALELGAAPWLPRLEALLLPEFLDADVLEVLRACPAFLYLERAGRVGTGASGGLPRPAPRRRDGAADGVGLFEVRAGSGGGEGGGSRRNWVQGLAICRSRPCIGCRRPTSHGPTPLPFPRTGGDGRRRRGRSRDDGSRDGAVRRRAALTMAPQRSALRPGWARPAAPPNARPPPPAPAGRPAP
jgi:hypothetical protein